MRLLVICLLCGLLVSCSKESTPEPINTTSNKSTTVDCESSTWKYEVILANPEDSGTFAIHYGDAYGNNAIDTTITSTWSHSFTMQYSASSYMPYINVQMGPKGVREINNTNVENDITVIIYRNNVAVATTGDPIAFCSGSNPPCVVPGTVNSIYKYYSCY